MMLEWVTLPPYLQWPHEKRIVSHMAINTIVLGMDKERGAQHKD